MRRVVSVWLPTWPTDRLRRGRSAALPAEVPLVTAGHDGRRRVVAAADRAARALGLRPGMALAHAQAVVPGLAVAEADPAGDAAALTDLAAWCLRYAPLTAADPPDGIWIDATGCAHLHGGEAAMLADLLGRLGRAGVAASAAIADTPGAAHAVARHAGRLAVVPQGGQGDALALLPVAALRIPPETTEGLRRLGLDLIGQLVATPRGPLARRFGARLLHRLDQALGRAPEPVTPVLPPDTIQHLLGFAEPLLTAEAFVTALAPLVRAVCAALERAGQGARRLDLVFARVDGTLQTIRIGTARPVRDPRHLGRLLEERIAAVDPGPGVESMRLLVTLAEPLAYAQVPTPLTASEGADPPDIAALVDRLANRFGAHRVYRCHPVESDVPERSVLLVPAMASLPEAAWPPHLPRPLRLLDPPQPVEAIGLLPDEPPRAFTWRGLRRRIRQADGPERIAGEWWRRDGEMRAVRDYWAVEDEEGRRYWLFRRGDGADPATGDLRWFLHGFF